MGVALCGMLVWSAGIVFMIYYVISSHDLQSVFVQRNFGYLLEGYEPRSWHWEIVVKKIDLLMTAIITYTSIASDMRAKLLLYAGQASVATCVQLSNCPYDDRQLNLLDRVENLGLFVRNALFSGVSFCLLFSTNAIITMSIAAILLTGNVAFLGKLALHSADDWVTTQFAMLAEKKAAERIDAEKKKRQEARDARDPKKAK